MKAVEYVITTEDQGEEEDSKKSERHIVGLRNQIRECERKVLLTEGERLDREKENVMLKDMILKLKKELNEKEAQLNKLEPSSSHFTSVITSTRKVANTNRVVQCAARIEMDVKYFNSLIP